MRQKKKLSVLTAAVMLVVLLSATTVFAYFTDYEEAVGGLPIILGEQTELTEEFEGLDKHVTIKNTGETEVVVRARIIGDEDRRMTVTPGENWVKKDGYYYYKKVLLPGEETTELVAEVKYPKGEENRPFDIIVVQECSQIYEENGRILANVPEFADVGYFTGEGE